MKPKRKHGLSRLERLLVKSISAELKIKSLKAELCALSARVAKLEPETPLVPLYYYGTQTHVSHVDQALMCPFPGCNLRVYPEHYHAPMHVSDSTEVWPYRPTFNGFTGLERSKP
jgi:hypothetical protein